MADMNIRNPYSFNELKWDSNFFKVKCAKAILYGPLLKHEWDELKSNFNSYEFISIENRNSEPVNSQFIGKETPAFLIDVNVQFSKKPELVKKPGNVTIWNYMERYEQIIEMAEFPYSKFIEDNEFYKRNGNQVYKQWVINSFNKPDKYFAVSRNERGEINGFLLYSFIGCICTIELMATAKDSMGKGIGTSLFKMVEYEAKYRGCDEIRVGTMIRNIGAINFYHKMGCKQVGCHQIYHLWNI